MRRFIAAFRRFAVGHTKAGARSGDKSPHSQAYTLLEVILALSLAAVILGLVTLAIHVHLGVATKSQTQVEEAQLARALLLRIAEDLRNAVPFRPTRSASSPESSGPTSQSTSAASSASSTPSTPSGATAPSGSTTGSAASASDTEPVDATTISTESIGGGGIVGNSQCFFVETSRQPRLNRLTAMLAMESAEPLRLSDIRTVTYCLGDPRSLWPGEQGDMFTSASEGLYRGEMDRAEFNWAMRQSETDALNQGTELLAPEVAQLQFTYYDGAMPYDAWDSSQQGKLPAAVKITIALRRATPQSAVNSPKMLGDASQLAIYDMLVDLPNSQVQVSQASSQSSQDSDSKSNDASKSESSSSQSPSSGNEAGGAGGGANKGSSDGVGKGAGTSRGAGR